MKLLTNEELKKVSLQIMIDVHSFCEKNNIRYTLGYGTLLGAVRHKGFIPWDDDIDIIMPRKDYEIFCKTYKSTNGYQVISSYTEECYLAYARVCDMEKTFVDSNSQWCKRETGVWIDIFPLDGAYEDFYKQDIQFKEALDTYDSLIRFRLFHKNRFNGIIHYCRYIKNIILFKSRKLLTRHYENICKEVSFGQTKYVQDLSCPTTRKKEVYPLSCLDSYSLIDFEGYKFYSMIGYDEALKCWYNDYMQLPPISDRVYSHSSHKYYWRSK